MWPKLMIAKGLSNVVRWLNAIPPKGGIHPAYSPRTIVQGKPTQYEHECQAKFGEFVQVPLDEDVTNTKATRTKDAVYLRPLDSLQGGHEVYTMDTGKVITRKKIIGPLPAPPQVIKRVEAFAKRDGMKPNNVPVLHTYTSSAGVDDNDSDSDYMPSDASASSSSTSDEEWDSDSDSDDDGPPPLMHQDSDYESDSDSEDEDDLQEAIEAVENNGGEPGSRRVTFDRETAGVSGENNGEQGTEALEPVLSDNPSNTDNSHDEPVPEPPRRSTRASTQAERLDPSWKGQSYANASWLGQELHEEFCHLLTQGKPEQTIEYTQDEVHFLAWAFVQQYSLHRGIKMFGDKGRQATYAEVKQMHDRKCFKPIHPRDIPREQRRGIMETVTFLVEKRDGRIKARLCANGSNQRTYIPKEDAASPTAKTESVFITGVIEAMEEREVAIIDIPNAFIQTLNEKLKEHHQPDILKVKGLLVEILVQIEPALYGPYVVYENGVPVLYMLVLMAIYGMVKSSLLFYRKLRKDMEKEGFSFNPYDICVGNKVINGKQLTVTFHVDDIKASHKETKVIDGFIEWCRQKYEDFTKIKPSRGKIHDYLGVTMDYSACWKHLCSPKCHSPTVLL